MIFLETWISRLLEVVCGASVGIMEDAASQDVIGGESHPSHGCSTGNSDICLEARTGSRLTLARFCIDTTSLRHQQLGC